MYKEEFIDYLVHFHGSRDYFECHEILEEYWKKDPIHSRKDYWKAFIQIAVSMYHHRNNNFIGAKRMMTSAIQLLNNQEDYIKNLGINYSKLVCLLTNKLTEINVNEAYQSMNLPIADRNLEEKCKNRCIDKGFLWQAQSDFSNIALIQKHTMRDRSDVIKAREHQKKLNHVQD